jgi:hypothetical protein
MGRIGGTCLKMCRNLLDVLCDRAPVCGRVSLLRSEHGICSQVAGGECC